MASIYDRLMTGPDPRETDAGEDNCAECGEALDERAQDRLDEDLADCEEYEDEENVRRNAMCTRCRKIDEGDTDE